MSEKVLSMPYLPLHGIENYMYLRSIMTRLCKSSMGGGGHDTPNAHAALSYYIWNAVPKCVLFPSRIKTFR